MEEVSKWEEQAIKAAMQGAWRQAIDFNQKILQVNPKDTAALNRLARAFWEKNQFNQAKKNYQKVLLLDPHNVIANKNIKRLGDQKQKEKKYQKVNFERKTQTNIFLEEPGKTKLIKLVALAPASILSTLNSAQEVTLVPKSHSINVTSLNNLYLGRIPDDLSHHLLYLMKGGNHYQAFIKTVDRRLLEVFIREINRASKFKNKPSFPRFFGQKPKN